MGGVGVAVQERDGHALRAGGFQPDEQALDLGFLQRLQHLAGVVHPLVQTEAKGGRHQRRELGGDVEPVEVAAPVAADLQHVLEPGGRDQSDRRQLAFHQRVGDPRGAVHEAAEVGVLESDRRDRLQHRLHRRVWARGHLGDAHLVGVGMDGDDVGEGAADIGADVPCFHTVASASAVTRYGGASGSKCGIAASNSRV